MSIKLIQDDFDRLVMILSTMPDFRTVQNRVDFVVDVFAGSSQRDTILTAINIDGNPRGVAVQVIDRLQSFGQDEPGRETLGVLINKMLSYIGGGEQAEFLRNLMERYPFSTPPTASQASPVNWRGQQSPEQLHEKIIGENTLRDMYILKLALDASKAVIRIVTPSSLGTGFVIGSNMIMTNNHVIRDSQSAQKSQYIFNYQIDQFGKELPIQIYEANPDGIFYTNNELDFSIIELLDTPDGVIPLRPNAKRVFRDERVSIIQHPGGHYKKISIQNNFVAYSDENILQYTTSTEPGSSGSPVFNDEFETIAIHHSGGMLLEPGSQTRSLRNAGTSMIAILKDIGENAPHIAEHLKD